jgi:hypothetical protein
MNTREWTIEINGKLKILLPGTHLLAYSEQAMPLKNVSKTGSCVLTFKNPLLW